jgi:archaellum component FlaG (FlaF/FlaG flagellin family)
VICLFFFVWFFVVVVVVAAAAVAMSEQANKTSQFVSMQFSRMQSHMTKATHTMSRWAKWIWLGKNFT